MAAAKKPRAKKQRKRHSSAKKKVAKAALRAVEEYANPDTPLRQAARGALLDHRIIGDRAGTFIDIGEAGRKAVAQRIIDGVNDDTLSPEDRLLFIEAAQRAERHAQRVRRDDQALLAKGMETYDALEKTRLLDKIEGLAAGDSTETRLNAHAGR